MAIYYLCSGFGMEHSFVNKFGELLSTDLRNRKNLVAIPCTEDEEEIKDHVSFLTSQLAEAGIVFEKQIILTKSMSQEDLIEHIKTADLIYLSGGYPFIQRTFVLGNNLYDSLHEYEGIILGISAGAMNMSKHIIMVTDGENSSETRIEDGLGLVDFSVYPHCAFSGDVFANSFYIGPNLVDSEKLLVASQNKGDVYFLQNKAETDKLKISFIRVENDRKDFVSIYEGRVWKATLQGFEIVKEYIQ